MFPEKDLCLFSIQVQAPYAQMHPMPSVSIQFSCIYIVPKKSKCHLKDTVQFKPITIQFIVIAKSCLAKEANRLH